MLCTDEWALEMSKNNVSGGKNSHTLQESYWNEVWSLGKKMPENTTKAGFCSQCATLFDDASLFVVKFSFR